MVSLFPKPTPHTSATASFDDSVAALRQAVWEGKSGFPLVSSSSPGLNENVMRGMGFTPGTDVYFTLKTDRNHTEHNVWPSEHINQAIIQPRDIVWHVTGRPALTTLVDNGVPVPNADKYRKRSGVSAGASTPKFTEATA